MRYPKEIRQFIYTTNQIERIAKEIKRRMKVIEVFPDEGSVERLLYLILKDMKERLNLRRLRGFNGTGLGDYHALPKDVLHNKKDTMSFCRRDFDFIFWHF